MDKMITVQKRLEAALLILAEDAKIEERQKRIYHECLCHITLNDLPRVLRRDYYQLLSLTNMLRRGLNPVQLHDAMLVDNKQQLVTALPGMLLRLYRRLTEWMAIEIYLRSQQHVLS